MSMFALVVSAVCIVCAAPARVFARAQEPKHDVNALAKETQNPLGNLITVPFQFNFNTGGDLEDRALFNLNVQPVIPFAVTANWNVIARTIVPMNVGVQYYYNVERPDGGPGQQLKFILTLLFPK